jgi:hypothetical protein
MKNSRPVVVLDTCVLAPMPVADTLFRLAEEPSFYTPKWSAHIEAELDRTLRNRFGYSAAQSARRLRAMRATFPDAIVTGYEDLIPSLKCDSKDRHVLAAAIKCGATCIVSDNGKHFPEKSLAPFGLQCLTADTFLADQFQRNSGAFVRVLIEQASDIGWTLPQLLAKHVPSLAKLVIAR